MMRQRLFLSLLMTSSLAACASTGPLNLTSEPLEYYNPGCEGFLFETSVSGDKAILKRTRTDGTDAGALVFRGETDAWIYAQEASKNLIIDNGEPAIAERETGRVCFRFLPEDTTEDACLASLIKTGAICTKVTDTTP